MVESPGDARGDEADGVRQDYSRRCPHGGVPCIRDLRVPVATIVGMVADGMSTTDILRAYPDLEAEDVIEALRFAADAVRERELPLLSTGRGS